MSTEQLAMTLIDFTKSDFFIPSLSFLISLFILLLVINRSLSKALREERAENIRMTQELSSVKKQNQDLHKTIWSLAERKFEIFITKEECDCYDDDDDDDEEDVF